jgi:XTP/dITP diphosphohydrolase
MEVRPQTGGSSTINFPMRKVVIATSNAGKLCDFLAAARGRDIELVSLADFPTFPAVEEDGSTFEENARKKAEHYSRFLPEEIVLADDSGLEVMALNGDPGVRSARWASGSSMTNADDAANNGRLLAELTEIADRRARFVCVIAAARSGQTLKALRGEVEGVVLREARGTGGFGYDPLFYVPELSKTFAELTPEQKAGVSHRGRAFEKFLEWHSREVR